MTDTGIHWERICDYCGYGIGLLCHMPYYDGEGLVFCDAMCFDLWTLKQ